MLLSDIIVEAAVTACCPHCHGLTHALLRRPIAVLHANWPLVTCGHHGISCATRGAQASDVRDSDNYSVFVVNYYPKTEGITWKPDTNRITPHTDETLVTLLFTSPGACTASSLLLPAPVAPTHMPGQAFSSAVAAADHLQHWLCLCGCG